MTWDDVRNQIAEWSACPWLPDAVDPISDNVLTMLSAYVVRHKHEPAPEKIEVTTDLSIVLRWPDWQVYFHDDGCVERITPRSDGGHRRQILVQQDGEMIP